MAVPAPKWGRMLESWRKMADFGGGLQIASSFVEEANILIFPVISSHLQVSGMPPPRGRRFPGGGRDLGQAHDQGRFGSSWFQDSGASGRKARGGCQWEEAQPGEEMPMAPGPGVRTWERFASRDFGFFGFAQSDRRLRREWQILRRNCPAPSAFLYHAHHGKL